MTKKLHNFIQGARQVLVLAPSVDYHWPDKGEFAQDMRNLREDAMRVSKDLRSTTEKYGEQVQNR